MVQQVDMLTEICTRHWLQSPCRHKAAAYTLYHTHLLAGLGLLERLGNLGRGDVGARRLERVHGVGELGAREARAAALLGRVVRVVGGGRVGLDGELCGVSGQLHGGGAGGARHRTHPSSRAAGVAGAARAGAPSVSARRLAYSRCSWLDMMDGWVDESRLRVDQALNERCGDGGRAVHAGGNVRTVGRGHRGQAVTSVTHGPPHYPKHGVITYVMTRGRGR